MKVLVTGGAGFIGSHVCTQLALEGHKVTVLDDFNDYYDPQIKRANIAALGNGIVLREGDIRNASFVQDVMAEGIFDSIIHLAARAGVRPSLIDPMLYIETNIVGTQNLLDSAHKNGVSKFVFASSSSVYGLAKVVPFSEELPLPQTLSPYAATKIAGEQLCGNYAHLYGMPVVCLRFFTVYGPGQRPDLAIHKFTDSIYHGKTIPQYGDGSTRRDYTYIDDIVQGVLGALRYQGPAFDIFNLGENQTTTLSELISEIEMALGKKAMIERLPEQQGDMPLTSADISKAQRLLGYNPTTKIRDGIPKFVEWYLSRQ
jgi:UDP-glucuronate 4-epimerase